MTATPDIAATRAPTIPDFRLAGVTWQCWITATGYEWRSACGRYAVWRAGRTCRARRGATVSANEFRDLWSAMWSAQNERRAAG